MRSRLSGLCVSDGSSLCIPPRAAPAKAGAFAYKSLRICQNTGHCNCWVSG
jgi:hypothetical protein